MEQELIHIFRSTVKFIEQSVADLTDQQMIEQPVGIPNHAAWSLGHIIFSCQGMAIELGAELWLPDDWEQKFGYGSIPSTELEKYPSKADFLLLLSESAERLCQKILSVGKSVLMQSLQDEMFPTMAHLLLQVMIGHTAYHAGQLAVWRKAIGKPSAGVFV